MTHTVRYPSVFPLPRGRLRRAVAAGLAAGAILCAVPARAQVVGNPNQIAGTIRFTNTNPAILDLLGAPGGEGFKHQFIGATSIARVPVLSHRTNGPAGGLLSSPYELTVEAGPPGAGIAYEVAVEMRLDEHDDRYVFRPLASLPVDEEPAPDVALDVEECAALLEVRFETTAGDPVTVAGGFIRAYRETSPGSGTWDAWARYAEDRIDPGHTTHLAVLGDGARYRVDIVWETGTDEYSDRVRHLCPHETTASCDEVVELLCVFDTGGGGGPCGAGLGRIVGNVDMLGEDEHPVFSYLTHMAAEDGPIFNYRFDWLAADPASGAFELENLMPSMASAPPRDYRVRGAMSFRLGRRYERFDTPWLDGSNGRVPVRPCETTDLGDTFVLDPGSVLGDILLAGPPDEALPVGSVLEDLYRDPDADGDGIPGSRDLHESAALARGVDRFAAGATKSAHGASAAAIFEGDYSDPDDAFLGDYALVLGALLREGGVWDANALRVSLRDTTTPETPESYQHSRITVLNRRFGGVELAPGAVAVIPHHYCVSQVNVTFHTRAGTFFDPTLLGSGEHVGTDFEGNPADYRVGLDGRGTPVSASGASADGLVVLGLPEGRYTLAPFVQALNPGGGSSRTELPSIDVAVGCRQIVDVTTDLQIAIASLPSCAPARDLAVEGAVDGVAPVARVAYRLDGGPEVEVCAPCGVDPAFTFTVPLEVCDNRLEVSATDDAGNRAAVREFVRFDPDPPVLACTDLEVEGDPASGGAVVRYVVTASDGCDGPIEADCVPPSGSTFPEGATTVSCRARDLCGGEATCAFSVHVDTCEPVEPSVRTQGFWKRVCAREHPSGETGRLPGYVEFVRRYATFAGVSDAATLCDRLHPSPHRDKCEQAEAQFMALLLNLASDRVRRCNCLVDPELGATTVGQAAEAIDALLADPGRTAAGCVLAQAVADRVNRGATLVDCAGVPPPSTTSAASSPSGRGQGTETRMAGQ